ncbi:MAG: hypothetical protein LC792_00470, partial [Actinobacteria bacterium]|nr:hypothetical protein [Actinomycetota bacterium]
IVGGTGEFYGATGTAQEVVVLRKVDPTADFMFAGLTQVRVFYTITEDEPEPFMLPGVQTESGGPEAHN